jgi:hypothetical protein
LIFDVEHLGTKPLLLVRRTYFSLDCKDLQGASLAAAMTESNVTNIGRINRTSHYLAMRLTVISDASIE